ncbi:hypothetical protein RJ641_015865 [Dillenia turbinata]|uniref:Uncharacterized protein n=1 Tax=Dillenia turbinata TaxID=194707 RepID=A0AAN8UYF3_9MAGN
MAAAEVRAAWQRTANRCFVQEDAKRAPKLACCPSSTSSSKPVEAGPTSAADGPDGSNIAFLPLNRNPSCSNLSPDTKWWLQLQPNYGCQKGFTYDQLNGLEAEIEIWRADIADASKPSGLDQLLEDDQEHVKGSKDNENNVDSPYMNAAACLRKKPEVKTEELRVSYNRKSEELHRHKDATEFCETMEMDPLGCTFVKKQSHDLEFGIGCPWIVGEKAEPWWRTADGDELVSLVARKSLDHIENCDLPRPLNTHTRRDQYAHLGRFEKDEMFPLSPDKKARFTDVIHPNVLAQTSLTSGSASEKQWGLAEGDLHPGTDNQSRYKSDTPHLLTATGNCILMEHLWLNASKSNVAFDVDSHCKAHEDMMDISKISGGDPSKAQLLEALCHSQTRAREAEKAAKQAYAEKEHVIELFFKQASHLFAYKQWFQLLQLETLYFQFKNKEQPTSTIFPAVLPWMPYRSGKEQKSGPKAAKRKRSRRDPPRYDIGKFAVAVALGLSLVGAGLLLGWTAGWMFPAL